MSREWWSGVWTGMFLAFVMAMAYGIAVVYPHPGMRFAFMCFRQDAVESEHD